MSNSNTHSGALWKRLAAAAQRSPCCGMGRDSGWVPCRPEPLPHRGTCGKVQNSISTEGHSQVGTLTRYSYHSCKSGWSFLPLISQFVTLRAGGCR